MGHPEKWSVFTLPALLLCDKATRVAERKVRDHSAALLVPTVLPAWGIRRAVPAQLAAYKVVTVRYYVLKPF